MRNCSDCLTVDHSANNPLPCGQNDHKHSTVDHSCLCPWIASSALPLPLSYPFLGFLPFTSLDLVFPLEALLCFASLFLCLSSHHCASRFLLFCQPPWELPCHHWIPDCFNTAVHDPMSCTAPSKSCKPCSLVPRYVFNCPGTHLIKIAALTAS